MPGYDLFISYPHADKEAVSAIGEALRARGLRVWLDEAEIADFESITQAIEQGLARAKALLAYYSDHYRRSRACQSGQSRGGTSLAWRRAATRGSLSSRASSFRLAVCPWGSPSPSTSQAS